MPQAHPGLSRSSRWLRKRLSDRLDRLEVWAANGARATMRARDAGWDQDWETARTTCQPCFTLSSGRSGTMTLALMGELCPDLESVHEPAPNLLSASFEATQGTREQDYWQSAIREARDWQIRRAHRRGRTWFETNNRMTFLADAIAAEYPCSKFLVVVRHPARFAESAVARGYYRSHAWDFARARPAPSDPQAPEWEHLSDLAKIGWLWQYTYSTAIATADKHPEDRVMFLRSEELFGANPELAQSILAFAGAKSLPSERQLKKLLQEPSNVQHHPAGSLEGDWAKTDVDAFYTQVSPLMDRFGYS